jgi:hypothetical protein
MGSINHGSKIREKAGHSAHTYDPNYSEGGDGDDQEGQPRQKNLQIT